MTEDVEDRTLPAFIEGRKCRRNGVALAGNPHPIEGDDLDPNGAVHREWKNGWINQDNQITERGGDLTSEAARLADAITDAQFRTGRSEIKLIPDGDTHTLAICDADGPVDMLANDVTVEQAIVFVENLTNKVPE